jgi:hypothetical protein
MPVPSNPFAGPAAGQRNGDTTPSGRGRGAQPRSSLYQVRKVKPQSESRPSSRGKGTGPASRHSRGGRDAAVGRNTKNKPAVEQISNSPFAQLKQNSPPTSPEQRTSPSGRGRRPSPFAGITRGSHGFGAPSTPGGALPRAGPTQDRRRGLPSGRRSKSTVPVENSTSMSLYHDRYEKVLLILLFVAPLHTRNLAHCVIAQARPSEAEGTGYSRRTNGRSKSAYVSETGYYPCRNLHEHVPRV